MSSSSRQAEKCGWCRAEREQELWRSIVDKEEVEETPEHRRVKTMMRKGGLEMKSVWRWIVADDYRLAGLLVLYLGLAGLFQCVCHWDLLGYLGLSFCINCCVVSAVLVALGVFMICGSTLSVLVFVVGYVVGKVVELVGGRLSGGKSLVARIAQEEFPVSSNVGMLLGYVCVVGAIFFGLRGIARRMKQYTVDGEKKDGRTAGKLTN